MDAPEARTPICFGVFELDAQQPELQRSGQPVHLRLQALRVLVVLASRPGELVTREELQHALWDEHTFVDFDQGLNQCVREIRLALGDHATRPVYVETVPRRGYRFVAPVQSKAPAPAARRRPWHLAAFLTLLLAAIAGLLAQRFARGNGSANAERAQATPLPEAHERLGQSGRVQPEAHAAYLRGRFLWNKREPEALHASVRHFEEALRFQPDYAPAWAGLADAYQSLVEYTSLSRRATLARAEQAALRALELDPLLAEAHTSLGGIYGIHEWRWDEAENHFERAVAINPRYATAYQWHSVVLRSRGLLDRALEKARQAHALDPLSPAIGLNLANALLYHGDPDEAMLRLTATLELEPNFAPAMMGMARAAVVKGDLAAAESWLDRALVLTPRCPRYEADRAYVAALRGRRSEARAVLARFDASTDPPYSIALLHLGLDEREAALDWLERAADVKDPNLRILAADPRLDALRDAPRFQALAARLGMTAGPLAGRSRSARGDGSPPAVGLLSVVSEETASVAPSPGALSGRSSATIPTPSSRPTVPGRRRAEPRPPSP